MSLYVVVVVLVVDAPELSLTPSLHERPPPLLGEISFSFDLIDAHGFGVTNGRESRSWHWAMELLMCSRPSLQ